MNIIYHPDAQAELIEAAQHYKQKASPLGEKFLLHFEAAIKRTLHSSEEWPTEKPAIGRFAMHRYPFWIYYRVEKDELRILSIKQHFAHPDHGLQQIV